MDFLYNLDISEKEIMEMIRNNKELLFLDDEKIKEVIYFLVKCGCTQKNIRNIIVANPYCFGRDVSDMEEAVDKIKGLGINDIDMFLENNPWFLSKDGFEIDEFITEKKNEGMEKEDILDMLETTFV